MMKLVFRFRTVTAIALLLCVVLNLLWPPAQFQLGEVLHGLNANWQSVQFGRAHAGVSLLCLSGAAVLAFAHVVFPRYSRQLSYATLLLSVLFLVFALGFEFKVPLIWLFPVWSSWRLSGSPLPFRS